MAQTKIKYPSLIDFETVTVDFLVIAGGGGGARGYGGGGGAGGYRASYNSETSGGGGSVYPFNLFHLLNIALNNHD